MRSGPYRSVFQDLHRLFDAGTSSGAAEDQLLERFLVGRDETAFEAIISRHGPMVVGVCRRLLSDPHDVEDAFQATFLVLVRRARAIRDPSLLGPWLYGVAHRVSVRARANSARRVPPGSHGAGERAVDPPCDVEWRDLAPVLDEEVGRLPERFRTPVVLCDLQGLTHQEAARQLGWPIGTVKSRLARARERLRARLTRRGIAPSAGFLFAGVTSRKALASPPSALVESTVRIVAGTPLAVRSASPSVVMLMEGALATMFFAKLWKAAAGGLLAIGLVAMGAEVLAQLAPADPRKLQPEKGNSRPKPPDVSFATRGAVGAADDRLETQETPRRRKPSLGPPPEIEVRLRSALRTLAHRERLAKTGVLDQGMLEETRTEVGILKAQIGASRDNLEDELGQLKAQLEVKKAELKVVEARQEQSSYEMAHLEIQVQRRPAPEIQKDLAHAKIETKVQGALIEVKKAEIHQVEVQIDQVTRRFAQVVRLGEEFLDEPRDPDAPPGRASAPDPETLRRP